MEEAPGIGHNQSPPDERVDTTFVAPGPTLAKVIDAITSEHGSSIKALSERATMLAANATALPQALDAHSMQAALELLAAIDAHLERADDLRTEALTAAQTFLKDLEAQCKPLDAGLGALQKKLRPLITDYLVTKLDETNAELDPDEPPMTSITERGASGTRASISMSTKLAITDAMLVPKEFCIPDMKRIETAIANDQTIPGTGYEPVPSLRIAS